MNARAPTPLVPARDLVAVLTTLPSALVAQNVAEALVHERLAACVNVVPGVTSTYRWQGQLMQDAEVLCVVKTQRDCLAALAKRLQELHPYELPELVVLGAEAASSDYWQWVRTATNPQP